MSIPYSRYIFASLPWYGVLIAAGVFLAIALCMHEEKRLGLKQDTTIDLALWVIPLGIIGARVYYALFNWQVFADDPLSVLRIWEGGIAIYGAVIGGLIGVCAFAAHRRMNPLLLTDAIVPGLSLAQGIGRWGNYFNMEAYGREITDPRWQFFPVGVQIPAGSGYTWHMATFFYESCWDMLVFIVLWFVIRKRSRKSGTVTLWYLLLYGAGRFIIEGLRTDSLMLGNFRVSQLLSLALVMFSGTVLVIRSIKTKNT
ncbi:MAG: prolipoprotein diacylglyceryl transferase [Clostridiales bacterium]|nr:prolipoprotein diacylglyceryl transferase [Clostridiales bacterium]